VEEAVNKGKTLYSLSFIKTYMKLFVSEDSEGAIIYFEHECNHTKKILRFKNGTLVSCKNEKCPVAFYLPGFSKEDALDFIKYFTEKSFLNEITDNIYLKKFLATFAEVEDIEFI